MAQTTYEGIAIVNTAAERRRAYNFLSLLCCHLPDIAGVNIVSITNVAGLITVVLSNPIPNDQEAHFGLVKV